MGQKEVIQDQLDILATNLEILNQRLKETPSGVKTGIFPSSNDIQIKEIILNIKKIDEQVQKLSQDLCKLNLNDINILNNFNLIKTPIEGIKTEVNSLKIPLDIIKTDLSVIKSQNIKLQEHSNYATQQTQKIDKVLESVDTVKSQIGPISKIEILSSSLRDVKLQLTPMTEMNIKIAQMKDLLDEQKTILRENQNHLLFLEKLNKQAYSDLHVQIQQLPFAPVNENTKWKLMQFKENEELNYWSSVMREIKSSKKEYPLLFIFVIFSMLIFTLAIIFVIYLFITNSSII